MRKIAEYSYETPEGFISVSRAPVTGQEQERKATASRSRADPTGRPSPRHRAVRPAQSAGHDGPRQQTAQRRLPHAITMGALALAGRESGSGSPYFTNPTHLTRFYMVCV